MYDHMDERKDGLTERQKD